MSIGKLRDVLGGLLTWLLVATLAAASAQATPLSLRFEHLGVEQGLSQETVNAILQDRHGFIWLGTQAGLNRFDGYRVTVFKSDPAAPGSVTDNYILALYEDVQGRLWVGSKGGLDRYDEATQSFLHQALKNKPGAGNVAVTAIVPDGQNGLWLGTSEGLQHLDIATGELRALRHDSEASASLIDDRIQALAFDAQGNLWIGTDAGLDLLKQGTAEFQHLVPADQDRAPVTALSYGADGLMWVGTARGMQAWRLQDGQAVNLNLSAADAMRGQQILVARHDRAGTLWIGTFANGLKRRDPVSKRVYSYQFDPLNRHGLGDNRINALYQDRTGSLWVGSWYAGVDRVDLSSGGFERYTESSAPLPSIGNNRVRAITGAGEQKLWLGTSDGLTRLDLVSGDTEIWRRDEQQANGLPGNLIFTLATDQQGRLWIGTTTGLGWRDPVTGKFTTVMLRAGINSLNIGRILVGRDGAIWVLSRAGLHQIDPLTLAIRSYLPDMGKPGSMAEGRTYAIMEDHAGSIWIGSDNGLDRLDRSTGMFRHYRRDPNRADSLSQNRVHFLYEDPSHRIWIGTSTGLCVAEMDAGGEPHFRFLGSNRGRMPDPIGAILGDKQGRLWFSTTSGMTLYDPATNAFKDYTAKDGLIEGSYFIGSAYKDDQGAMYFGGLAGVTAFRPSEIHDNPHPPKVVITDFSIFNQSILAGNPRTDVMEKGPIHAAKSLSLSYRDAVFSFEFAGLHFADPNRNRYAYQLEGFDTHWVYTDAGKRFATYTNLDPGRYVFRVKASNKDGLWSTEMATVELTIAPPFWRTWWFRLLTVSLLLGAAYALFRMRLRMLLRQTHELEEVVGARTRELLEQKESIERQKESVESAHRNISLLSEIGRNITANLESEAIMSQLYQQVNQLMDASVFGIGIYRPDRELIEYPFAMERGQRYMPYTRSMREPNQLAVWCITHGSNILINDLEHEYQRYIDSLELVTGAEEMGLLEDGTAPVAPRSLIYVPISLGGKVRGVITVHSYRAHAYQRVDLDMLNTLASYVAVAIDNADAYRQLKDTQQQLVEREKLAALGALVAGVAHELNTPIGNSLVIASTLEDKTVEIEQKSSSETLRRSDLTRFIEAAKEASLLLMRSLRNAAELVNSFKQVAVDQASANRRAFDLHQASQEIVLTMMSQIRKAGHQVELDIPEGIGMDSFPGPYGQVIINLINNAMLHGFDGQPGGVMRLSATAMPGGRVRIIFQDNGRGIAPENVARIFDPFFTTKLGQGGNGLGLSVTYNIVTSLLGGTIRVDSALDVGTIFTIDLPLTATAKNDL